MDAHPPVPVTELTHLQHDGPTLAEEYVRKARAHDLLMPAAVALTIVIVALGVTIVMVAVAVVERLAS